MRSTTLLRKTAHLYEEIKIPVPWGHIAGKWWGNRDARPILFLHGWQDNAGSFDRLIPLLKPNLSYLAVDLPGHGRSSHLPTGATYQHPDFVIFLRRIVLYFNWPKVSLLCHSLSACTAYNYATFFPTTVDFLIALDALKPVTQYAKVTDVGKKINDLIKYDNLIVQGARGPSYTLEEMKRRIHETSHGSISLDACKYVLERSIKRSAENCNEYHFTTDLRLKQFPLFDFKESEVMAMVNRFTCPTLLFLAKQKISRYYLLTETPDFFEAVGKINSNFEIHHVDGNHHVHLNNPEYIAERINEFIAKFHDTECVRQLSHI